MQQFFFYTRQKLFENYLILCIILVEMIIAIIKSILLRKLHNYLSKNQTHNIYIINEKNIYMRV